MYNRCEIPHRLDRKRGKPGSFRLISSRTNHKTVGHGVNKRNISWEGGGTGDNQMDGTNRIYAQKG